MKKNKVSLILNSLIVLFVTAATIMMFAGIRFTGNELVLESNSVKMFRFFTVDSNILVGIAAIIMIIFEVKLMKKSIKKIPTWVYILKELATVSVAVTFFVTALFLGPTIPTGYLSLYTNSNLFYHLIVPVLSMVSYVAFEKYDNKYVYSFYGMLPTVIYSLYYFLNIMLHLDKGVVSMKYDFYNFLNGNIYNAFISLPVMYLATLGISYVLILLNKKILK